MISVQGKVALITGAGGGIGRGLCLAFAKEGAALIINDINAEAAAETTRLVQAQGVDTVEVRAERENMTGIARSASEGIVSGERLRALPLLRPGEVLEKLGDRKSVV